jgi:ABC-type multidrug transport system permease subunit
MLARLREFYREPEAVFWVYGFPILMIVTLGIAFRSQPVEKVTVDIEAGSAADSILNALGDSERYTAEIFPRDEARRRLRTARTDIVVSAGSGSSSRYEFSYDPARPEGILARDAVNDALQRAAGRQDVVEIEERTEVEPGGRYIDFLVPGMLGMSLMGGGMWGVGFVTVDMRIRKLLKRFLATPMKKSHFLCGIMLSRLVFMIPEVLFLLVFARLAFGVVIHGSVLSVVLLILLGAGAFAGLGLLVASRARTLEAVSGLMNLAMLPMWVLSGIFFSRERFPDAMQPLISALPLTPLIDSLRAVMLEGVSITALTTSVVSLLAWGLGSFVLALWWFRWS